MQYKGCTLEYWDKCRSQDDAITFCRNRGSELFSYIDGTDIAAFSTFVGRQSSATRYHSVATCGGYGAYWPTITAIVWTALRARGGNNCGVNCVWQDLRTGNLVTDIASIKPCNMEGGGDAVEFDMRTDGCPSGGSNDNVRTSLSHFICGAACGEWPGGLC
jgi:hypothetical protein